MNAPAVPIVVGMTTLPSRMELLRPALESLLCGELVPDKIYLSLPALSLREQTGYSVPEFLRDPSFSRSIVEIVDVDRDFGPGTKLLGALTRISGDAYVVLADDDVRYGPSFLQTLVDAQRQDHSASFSFCTYALDGLPVGQGVDGFSFWSRNLSDARAFYARHVDGTDLMFHDDLWISFYLMSRGIQVKSLQPLLNGGLIYERLYVVNSLNREQGRLARHRLAWWGLNHLRASVPQRAPLAGDQPLSRNAPCPCGSGKRYKNCHGALT